MTREHQHTTEEEILDQQWDAYVTGRTLIAGDPTIRQLHAAQTPAAPSPMFVSQLRSMIEVAAQDQIGAQPNAQPRTEPPTPLVTQEQTPQAFMRPVHHRPGRMRGLSRAGKVVSVLLAASLLVAIAGAMIRYPFTSSNGTGAPTNQPPGTSIAAVSSPVVPNAGEMASSADPGRTNVQPGPGPSGIPKIVGHADISGDRMALGGDTIVIVESDTVTALDANTLATRWSVEVPWGVYTEPVVAGDAIYFGFTGQREGTTEYLLGADQPNQLVSLSLKDGSENWRIDEAGSAPTAPLVVNGTIYAVGSTPDAYRLGAFDAVDGHTLWTTEPFASKKTDDYPKVIPYIWMALTYGDGLIVTNQAHALSAYDAGTGKSVWTHDVTEPDLVDAPLVADGAVVTTIGHQSADDKNPGSARIMSFDLRTGQERWAKDPVSGNMFGFVSATQRGSNLVTTQLRPDDKDKWLTVSINSQSGEQTWSEPSWDSAVDPGPNFWQGADAAVSVSQQVFTLGVASDRGNQARTLVTARDIATGEVDWTTIVDGTFKVAPIIAGGKIYVLTDLFGLQVLGGTETVATPAAGTADLRGPDECTTAPIENPLLSTPEANGEPVPAWARWGEVMSLSKVPAVDPANAVSPEVADAIGDVIAGYRACMVQGDPQLLFGLFSDHYYQRLRAMEGWNFDGKNGESGQQAVQLAGSNERIDLDPATLQTWPDGRVGGILHGNTDMYVWFVDEDGTWKIDEFHRIMDTWAEPEESPSSEG